MKTCTRCNRALDDDRFARDSRSSSGLRAACRDCVSVAEHARRAKDPAGWRERSRAQYAANPQRANRRQVERRRSQLTSRLRHVEEQARRRALARGCEADPLDYVAIADRDGWVCPRPGRTRCRSRRPSRRGPPVTFRLPLPRKASA